MRDEIALVVKYKKWSPQTFNTKKRQLFDSSEEFKKIISQRPGDSTQAIVIEGFHPKIVQDMLRHIFKKPLFLDGWDLALELFRFSVAYDIKSLRLICKRYFATQKIRPSEAIKIYKAAKALEYLPVEYACLEIFSQNTETVMLCPDFKRADEEQVRAILEASKLLSPSSMLALINWCSQKCVRQGVAKNRANIELYIARLCGRSVAIQVCDYFDKLRNSENLARQKSLEHDEHEMSAINIVLKDEDSPDKMQSVFKTDVICEIKITILKGFFHLTGFRLLLKSKASSANQPGVALPKERTLEVFYKLTNQSLGSVHCNEQMSWVGGENLDVMLSEHFRLRKGDTAILNVCVEDLPPRQCLMNSKEEQFFKRRDTSVSLNFVGNQSRGNCKPGPFFIGSLFYET